MTTALSAEPVSATLSLLEVYETPIPPPGAPADYPVAHSVIRLRLENRSLDPVQIPGGHLTLQVVESGRSLLSVEVEPISLGGLQIGEQGFHLTGPEPLALPQASPGAVQAVYRFTLEGVTHSVTSEPMPYPPAAP